MTQAILNHRLLPLTAGLVVFLVVLLPGCESLEVSTCYEHGAVASAAPIASDLGARVFEKKGNAFDAAVVVGLALAVVHPEAGNIGGGGFAVIRDGKTGDIRTLDFRETAPAAATTDMYLDSSGAVIENASTLGARAAGVPGTVAGLYELWDVYGSLPWPDLVQAAARLADTGFTVDSYLAESLEEYRTALSRFEETGTIFLPGGQPLSAGDRLVQKDLAHTLYGIAADGPDGFYTGDVADSIVACMEKYGGLITHEDLESYRPVWREPVHFTFDSLDIYSMAPPSSGGVIMGQILKLLEPYDFSRYTPNSPKYIHLFSEASRLAFADRSEHLGDPAFWSVPGGLLDSTYLTRRRQLINPDHATPSATVRPGRPSAESDQTTHFSICDGAGNMVSITYTLNTSYGCKLTVGGAGFLLNNEMDDFSIKPGVANTYGLVGGEANKIEPGKRMLSSMSPTLVLDRGRPLFALGSPGGSKIITTVAEAIIDLTRFHLSGVETAAQPRFHHQWLPDILYLEEGGYTPDVIKKLTAMGYDVQEREPYGDLQLLMVDDAGLMTGVSDPRKRGTVAGQ